MDKKGQVSIFLLAVISILILFFLVFSNQKIPQVEQLSFEPEINYFKDCLIENAKIAVMQVSMQGGYFQVEPPSVDIAVMTYPLYYFKGKIFMPTKNEVVMEVAEAFDDLSKTCEDTFVQLYGSRLEAAFGEAHSNATINEQSVEFTVEYPLHMAQGPMKKTISSFAISVPANLNIFLEASDHYVATSAPEEGGFCVTCASEITQTFGLQAESNIFDEVTVIALHKGGEMPLTWVLAIENK